MSVMWETATLVKNGVTYWLKDEKARALIKECYSPSNPPPSSGGAVASVNGKTGVVELDASDVGALPDTTVIPTKTSDLTNDSGFIDSSSVPSPSSQTPEPLGTAAAGASTDYSRADHVHQKPTYSKTDVGLGNVDNVLQYSAQNPPPYPVSSVNGQVGAVTIVVPMKTSELQNDSGYVDANGAAAAAPVQSVNGSTGAVFVAGIEDIQLIENVGTATFTLPAGGSENVVNAGHVTEPAVPDGYEVLLYGARATGDASVVSVQIGNLWIKNTSNQTSRTLTAAVWKLIVKRRTA